jgi:hypothetical protein
MSCFQIVSCEEQDQACGSAYLTWQDDGKCLRAKVSSDPNEKIVKKFADDLQKNLQAVFTGQITTDNASLYFDRAFDVFAESGLFDGCPISTYVGGIGYPDTYITDPYVTQGKQFVIGDILDVLLSGLYGGPMVGVIVDVNICVGKCGLGVLTMKFSSNNFDPYRRNSADYSYLVELCECGAKPKVLSGTSTFRIDPEIVP